MNTNQEYHLPPKKLNGREFKIWEIIHNHGEETIKVCNYLEPIGFSKNDSLVVIDKFGKKRWIKPEFFNSTEAPLWRVGKRFYVIREVLDHSDLDWTGVLAIIRSNSDELKN